MTVRYAIRPAVPGAHLFHVTVDIEDPDPDGQQFQLPAWIPGSYKIREFARHIVRLTALAGSSKVAVEKTDKHTWRCAPRGDRPQRALTLAYEVYAWDLSVRAAQLDDTHGFFNGACVFLLPLGKESEVCTVDILPPDGAAYRNWRVATGLAATAGTRQGVFGTYRAQNFDELIDCPVLLGDFTHAAFDVLGTPHEIAITAQVPRLDLERLRADLTRVCEAQIRLFEPRAKRAPFERYSFLTLALGDAYGGLEHRNSTALLAPRDSLPYSGMTGSTEAYRRFLGVGSHEYFHAWNVKRIRPAAFVPYDLTRENYTRLLWLFEGFTSYYDDLMLARAGLLTETQYLEGLGTTLTTVLQQASRRKQSLADSSFDAWIKYYHRDENAPNSVVSYYQKGALIAAALDLTVRHATRGRRSLDDTLRLLWRRYKKAGAAYAGVAEDEVATLLAESTGLDLEHELRAWTDGTDDPDFAKLLAPFGVQLQRHAALLPPHFALLGCRTAAEAQMCRVTQVHDGSPAQRGGLSAGDLLVALDGLRLTVENLDARLARYAAGDTIELLVFRHDALLRCELQLATAAPPRFVPTIDAKASASQTQQRRRWLRG